MEGNQTYARQILKNVHRGDGSSFTHHHIVVTLSTLKVNSWNAMTSTQCAAKRHFMREAVGIRRFKEGTWYRKHLLVHLPLIWRTIVATLAAAVFKLQSDLQSRQAQDEYASTNKTDHGETNCNLPQQLAGLFCQSHH